MWNIVERKRYGKDINVQKFITIPKNIRDLIG
jgi:hypothetical protein